MQLLPNVSRKTSISEISGRIESLDVSMFIVTLDVSLSHMSRIACIKDMISFFCASSLIFCNTPSSNESNVCSSLTRLFMVHRQDFIRPLCKGLCDLKKDIAKDPSCLSKRWTHDYIRVYRNIQFLNFISTCPCFKSSGLRSATVAYWINENEVFVKQTSDPKVNSFRVTQLTLLYCATLKLILRFYTSSL
jgi:hypothetical protein